jgi:hypothetical protein
VRVVAVGSVDRRDERPKLVVDTLVPLEQAEREGIEQISRLFANGAAASATGPRRYRPNNRPAPAEPAAAPRALRVTIDHHAATEATLARLAELVEGHSGSLPLVLAFTEDAGATVSAFVRTATRVEPEDALVEEIRAIPGVLAIEKTATEFG